MIPDPHPKRKITNLDFLPSRNAVYDGTTGLDRTRQDFYSPVVALHSAGLRVPTTGTTGLMTFFQ